MAIVAIKQNTPTFYKRYIKYILFFILLFGLPVVLSAIRYNVGTDFLTYEEMYTLLKNEGFLFSSYPVEVGYKFICLICWIIYDSPQTVIIITGIIPIAVIYIGWIKNKNISLFAIFFIYYTVLFGLSMNNIRQSMAIAFIIVAYMFLENKKLAHFFLMVMVATLFHTTSILCLVFVLFTKKSIDYFKLHKINIVLGIIFLGIIFVIMYLFGILDVYLQRYSFQFSFNYKHFLLRMSINVPLIWYLYKKCKTNNSSKFYILILLLELFFWLTTILFAWTFRFAYFCIPAHMFILYNLFSNKVNNINIKLFKIYVGIWYPCYFIIVYFFLLNDGIMPYYSLLFKYL